MAYQCTKIETLMANQTFNASCYMLYFEIGAYIIVTQMGSQGRHIPGSHACHTMSRRQDMILKKNHQKKCHSES